MRASSPTTASGGRALRDRASDRPTTDTAGGPHAPCDGIDPCLHLPPARLPFEGWQPPPPTVVPGRRMPHQPIDATPWRIRACGRHRTGPGRGAGAAAPLREPAAAAGGARGALRRPPLPQGCHDPGRRRRRRRSGVQSVCGRIKKNCRPDCSSLVFCRTSDVSAINHSLRSKYY